MNPIKSIRERLGLTQEALAEVMGCTQPNIGHYERGQTVPPEAAKRLIAFAKSKGKVVTFDEIYATPTKPKKTVVRQIVTATYSGPDRRGGKARA